MNLHYKQLIYSGSFHITRQTTPDALPETMSEMYIASISNSFYVTFINTVTADDQQRKQIN